MRQQAKPEGPDSRKAPGGSGSLPRRGPERERYHASTDPRSWILGLLIVGLLAVAGWVSAASAAEPEMHRTPAIEDAAVRDAAVLIDLWIEEQLAYGRSPSLTIGVVHDGELIWSGGYGFADVEERLSATTETPYRLGSVSKIFTATAILILRDRGQLTLDDPVSRYLPGFRPENPFPDQPEITLRHLLTHTAGLPREGAFPYWTTHEFPPWEAFEKAAENQRLTHPPGEHYLYSNLGMGALGAVVAAVSGKSYAQFLRDEIANPLGLGRTTADPSKKVLEDLAAPYFRKRPDGSRGQHTYYDTGGLASMGNVVSTLEDLARFAAFLLSEEPAGPAQSLSGATLREMRRPHFVYPSFSGGRGLGFGISRRNGKTLVSHGGWIGGHRSHLLLSPDERIAVVALTNADDASPYFFSYQALDLFSEALSAVPAESKALDPAWERLYGLYSDPWEWEYRVLPMQRGLVVYEYNYPPLEKPQDNLTPLEWVDGTDFRMPDGDPFRFELDGDGKVVRIQRRSDFIFPIEWVEDRDGLRPVLRIPTE